MVGIRIIGDKGNYSIDVDPYCKKCSALQVCLLMDKKDTKYGLCNPIMRTSTYCYENKKHSLKGY